MGKKEKTHISLPLIFSVLTFLSLFISFCVVLFSHGEQWPNYVFSKGEDTGMDFFNSIVCASTRDPYGTYGTLYPPLANLFFYGISVLVPRNIRRSWPYNFSDVVALRFTKYDLRIRKTMLYIFVLVVIIMVFMLFWSNYLVLKKNKYGVLISTATIFTYGPLYALERGNVVVMVSALTCLYLYLYKNENRFLKEISLLSLSFAIGFKMYPAVFSVLLLSDKDYWGFIRVVIYSLIGFFAPLTLFGGLSSVLIFWNKVLGFLSFDMKIVIMLLIAAPFSLILLIYYLRKEKYFSRKVLVLSSLILIVTRAYGGYITVFELLSFVFFLEESEDDFSLEKIILFICYMLMILPYGKIAVDGIIYRKYVDKYTLFMSLFLIIISWISNLVKKKSNQKIYEV